MQRRTAKKIVMRGEIKFDSLDEAKYYDYLVELQAQGIVTEFARQVKIELIPALTCFDGSRQRPIFYIADFWVKYSSGYASYVEVKGWANVLDLIKRKLFNYWNSKQAKQIPLQWVSYSKKWGGETGFCDYDYIMRMRKDAKK